MTADVIQGVTEKCEEHGIHHYISKPLDPELFIKTITQILYACIGSVNEESSILDRSNNMKLFGGNYQLYEKVLAQYYNENQETAEQLNIAIDENRFAEAIQIVHKLKGSTGSIGAKHLYKVARKLQKALEDENETEIRQLLPVFNQSLRELLKTIKASVKEINDSE
jgi:HPt (histidine-containing phosphotransfer) domain-containing protein